MEIINKTKVIKEPSEEARGLDRQSLIKREA
jgi:hypothetical protein